ncbi:Hypothetical protein HVR_LOCUS381 [uncultured virus]|nr:Hypothetical protein HVR_LOCUS381 [uncultured virus]
MNSAIEITVHHDGTYIGNNHQLEVSLNIKGDTSNIKEKETSNLPDDFDSMMFFYRDMVEDLCNPHATGPSPYATHITLPSYHNPTPYPYILASMLYNLYQTFCVEHNIKVASDQFFYENIGRIILFDPLRSDKIKLRDNMICVKCRKTLIAIRNGTPPSFLQALYWATMA